MHFGLNEFIVALLKHVSFILLEVILCNVQQHLHVYKVGFSKYLSQESCTAALCDRAAVHDPSLTTQGNLSDTHASAAARCILGQNGRGKY